MSPPVLPGTANGKGGVESGLDVPTVEGIDAELYRLYDQIIAMRAEMARLQAWASHLRRERQRLLIRRPG